MCVNESEALNLEGTMWMCLNGDSLHRYRYKLFQFVSKFEFNIFFRTAEELKIVVFKIIFVRENLNLWKLKMFYFLNVIRWGIWTKNLSLISYVQIFCCKRGKKFQIYSSFSLLFSCHNRISFWEMRIFCNIFSRKTSFHQKANFLTTINFCFTTSRKHSSIFLPHVYYCKFFCCVKY